MPDFSVIKKFLRRKNVFFFIRLELKIISQIRTFLGFRFQRDKKILAAQKVFFLIGLELEIILQIYQFLGVIFQRNRKILGPEKPLNFFLSFFFLIYWTC